MTKRTGALSLVVALAMPSLAGCAGGAGSSGARSADAAAREAPPPREETPEEKEASSRRTGRVAGYVAIAVGAQAGIVALVTSGMMLHEDSIRDSECNPDKRCTQAGIDSNENLQQLGTWNAGAWVVGLGGIAVGTVLLLLNPAKDRSPRPGPSRENEKKAGLVLGAPGGPGLGIQGTF